MLAARTAVLINGYPPCDIGCSAGAGVVAGGALYIWDRSSRSRILGARNVPMPVAAKCSLACSIEKTAMDPLDIETVAVRVSVMYSKEPSAMWSSRLSHGALSTCPPLHSSLGLNGESDTDRLALSDDGSEMRPLLVCARRWDMTNAQRRRGSCGLATGARGPSIDWNCCREQSRRSEGCEDFPIKELNRL